jgi:antitoxin ParD1/3/4
MVTRNVVLTESQDELVQGLISSGRYQNASEALRAGLRLLEHEEAGLAELRSSLRLGLTQAEKGDLAEGTGPAAIRRAFNKARSGA